jgi:predicted 3-demethylubiquinone-9 3-methyltransferase (glyoxalase superfamily)
VPTVLVELLQDQDAQKSQRVMQALMQMTKLDIARLKQAYAA